ncbi:ATP-NAD kinase family protein [Streptomyces sp. NPDC051561]|uniref:ATP-NAD kinase family protein n=1 Tax=Streptomyces sp. NPDC051561 TaxID=3365658 RepID=UPI0037A48A46
MTGGGAATRPRVVGLVVNPVAGLGGRVGLEGSDGTATQRRALQLGAAPHAGERAAVALAELSCRYAECAPPGVRFDVLTAAGRMGEEAVRAAGLVPGVVYAAGGAGPGGGAASPGAAGGASVHRVRPGATGAQDTVAAVRALVAQGAELILFAGGDGTARDVLAAVGEAGGIPVLGIPTGVKMHSAVFAVNPRAAGEVAAAWLNGRGKVGLREAEVMDRDEARLREGRLASRLYGWLPVPYVPVRVQQRKAGSTAASPETVSSIAAELASRPAPGDLLALGPGTTTRAVAAALGADIPLTGVSLLSHEHPGRTVTAAPGAGPRPPTPTGAPPSAPPPYRLLATHLSSDQLLAHLAARPAHLALSPIGGQGFLLGRGNQQLSPEVLRAVGDDRLHVLCTEAKLAALHGRPLLVDTGDDALDAALCGYRRVITGLGRTALYRITG